MPTLRSTELLARALAACGLPLLYWLGAGGYTRGARPDSPGTPIDVQDALARKQAEAPAIAAQYRAGLDALGLPLQALPDAACDCSGFVTWALGLPRGPGLLGRETWINTDAVVADAQGAQRLFSPAASAEPGMLLVYPSPGRHQVGHIGIVTAAAGGVVRRVVHCAPQNFMLAPAPGRARSAIAETGPALFDGQPRLLAVRCKLVVH